MTRTETPRELVDMCLLCKRPVCPGSCAAYERREKELEADGPRDSLGRLIGGRVGYGMTLVFMGREMTVPEFAKICGAKNCAVYKQLKRGRNPEQVYKFYLVKHAGG